MNSKLICGTAIIAPLTISMLLFCQCTEKQPEVPLQTDENETSIFNAPLSEDEQNIKERNIQTLSEVDLYVKERADEIADACTYAGRAGRMDSTWITSAEEFLDVHEDEYGEQTNYYVHVWMDNSDEYYILLENGGVYAIWKNKIGDKLVMGIAE